MNIKYIDEKLYFNLSTDENYYSQRNNELDPFNSCATTNIVQGLELCGYDLPKGKYNQAEDNLLSYIRTNKKVLNFYKTNYPQYYAEWYANPSSSKVYQPNELHKVNEYAVNLYYGKQVIHFDENFDIRQIPYELFIRKRPLIMSGLFNKLNHIVTLVGMNIDKKNVEYVIDDTYGNFRDKNYKGSGNDIILSEKEFLSMLKPFNNLNKWAYVFDI